MAFLRAHQLNIMLFLSGICGILAFLALHTKSLPSSRKSILAAIETSGMLLLIFDRYAYIYRGDPSSLGYVMVRISNGLVYFLSLFFPHLITRYLYDLFRHEGGLTHAPRRLMLCDFLFVLGTALIIVSQFTGLYYTFDESNTYQRASGHLICYVIPIAIVLIQESTILKYRSHLNRRLGNSLMLSISLPTVASVVQVFTYGLSLTNMTVVIVAIVFYLYALNELGEKVEKARMQEIEFYKAEQKREAALFEQTAQALVNAIDAKDSYTHGHSSRVAMYSRQIAQAAGLSDKACEQVYFAALLHDVGKIGVDNSIINKPGKLTEEEFAQIKLHTIYGNQILSSIQQSPYLSIGAHYHHERYDGKGYPDGLAGEDIPEIARIIAVADSYDAMTSQRSYREPIPEEKVRSELENGIGTQFDPRFARIMLRLMEDEQIRRIKNSSSLPIAENA